MADALDLPHRHPKLWKRVRRGQVPAWQARRVAQQTRRLPQGRCPVGRRPARPPDRLRTRHHRPARRPGRRPVRPRRTPTPRRQTPPSLSGRRAVPPAPGEYAGASDLSAHGDTLTLQAFYDLVCAIAHQLFRRRRHQPARRTEDQGPRRHRRPRHRPGHRLRRRPASGPARSRPTCTSRPTTSTRTAVGTVEKLGAATLAKIKSWVGHHQVVIQPVLNLQRRDAVDSHDPPPWMRDLVILRDGHCVFPGCTRDARACDLDHIDPYDPERPTRPNPPRQPRLPLQDDTTAPRPSDSGATRARPTATTSGTAPTAPRTSSHLGTPTGRADHNPPARCRELDSSSSALPAACECAWSRACATSYEVVVRGDLLCLRTSVTHMSQDIGNGTGLCGW